MQKYDKLVRDKIPQIIKDNNQTPITRILSNQEYKIELNRKLKEEMLEYFEDNSLEELADVVEVIYAILNFNNVSLSDFEQMLMMAKLYIDLVGEGLSNLDNLNNKLQEEILDYLDTDYIKTLANVVGLIYVILEFKEVSPMAFEEIRKNKVLKNGAFHKKIFLESVSVNSNFLDVFTQIIKECKYNNTYKMAWAKSLVELACEKDYINNQIPLIDISRKYIKYYWNCLINGDFKQGQKPPRMIKIVKRLMNIYASQFPLDKFENVEQNLNNYLESDYEVSLKEGVKVLKTHVIFKFINIDGEEHDELYQFVKRTNFISIRYEDLKLLKENKNQLIDLIDYRWGLILERFMRIRTSAKIVNDNLNQELLEKFKGYLY